VALRAKYDESRIYKTVWSWLNLVDLLLREPMNTYALTSFSPVVVNAMRARSQANASALYVC
jgi:hypothetical protein